MKNIFEIKPEFQSTVVGFNNSGLPLGSRSDLDKLAMMAHVNAGLAKYFVELPTKEQIIAFRENRMLGDDVAPTETQEVKEEPETPEEPEEAAPSEEAKNTKPPRKKKSEPGTENEQAS
jgi:hypothetical protein